MLRGISWPELIIVLVIVILVFGVGRISKISGEIGAGIKSFKDGLSGRDKDKKSETDDEDKSSNGEMNE